MNDALDDALDAETISLDQQSKAPTRAPAIVGELALAEVVKSIQDDAGLPLTTKRQWISSINSLSKALGKPAVSLPARMSALRHPIRRINAAHHGWEPKTLANHQSNLAAALEHVGQRSIRLARGAPLSPAWEQLLCQTPPGTPKRVLYGLARFGSAFGIGPSAVTNQTIDDLFDHREATTFRECGLARKRELIRSWNFCQSSVAGWPLHRLEEPQLPARSTGPAWEIFFRAPA